MSYRVRLIFAIVVSAILLITWQLLINKPKEEEEKYIEETSIVDTVEVIEEPELTTSQHTQLPDNIDGFYEDSSNILLYFEVDSVNNTYTFRNKDIEVDFDLLRGGSINKLILTNYYLSRGKGELLLYPLFDSLQQNGMIFSVVKNEDDKLIYSTKNIGVILDTVIKNENITEIIFTQKIGIIDTVEVMVDYIDSVEYEYDSFTEYEIDTIFHQFWIAYQIPDSGYMVDVKFWSEGINKQNYAVFMSWEKGMGITEPDLPRDNGKYRFIIARKLEGYSYIRQSFNKVIKGDSIKGKVLWAGVSNQYFMSAFISIGDDGKENPVELKTEFFDTENKESYSVDLTFGPIYTDTVKFIFYVGPLDEKHLGSAGYGLEENIQMGWKWLKPISKVILLFIRFIYNFIPNYGFVLIVFALLMTLVFSPLTMYSQKSMKRMQELQPKLADLKKKHGNDSKKLNEETMKLYKTEAFNPLSGCLPMLLQMPVFMALYQIMRTTIVLRGQSFLWIPDLSRPETTIPFQLPFTSAAGIGILPLLMGAMMFLQQKMTNPNPQQKAFTYIMPIFLTFLFISFPAAIVLYWTAYNSFGLIMQLIVKYRGEKKGEVKLVDK